MKTPFFGPHAKKRSWKNWCAAMAVPCRKLHLRAVYREILSSSRRIQRQQRAAYLGPEGTFSYFAGLEYLGRSTEYTAKPDFEDVFSDVFSGKADYGVIPLENSLQGTVGKTVDLFSAYDVFIQAEVFCRVSHSLLSKAEHLAEVEEIHSHPQALEQAGPWLRANVPNARIIPSESTAAAAGRVGENPKAAAVAHARLAELYDLNVLATGIESEPDNWTRFCIIGKTHIGDSLNDKTSVLFTTPDKPGALSHILNLLAERDVNMSKLESRPLKGEKWKYVFSLTWNAICTRISTKGWSGVLKMPATPSVRWEATLPARIST